MVKCSFCGHELAKGTGTMYVKKDASIYYFCSRKCQVSLLEHNRIPRKFKWTTAHGKREKKV